MENVVTLYIKIGNYGNICNFKGKRRKEVEIMNLIIDISAEFVTLVNIETKKVLAIVDNEPRTNKIFINYNKRIHI